MQIFVVFKKQAWEKVNSYSLVTPEILLTIPPEIIHNKKNVEDRKYSKEELENIRTSLL